MLIKRICLISILAIWLGFALHETFLQFSLQLYLSYAAKNAGYELSYREVVREPNRLTLVAPEISFGKSGGGLKAKEIQLAYQLHPFSRTLDLEIALERPSIEFHGEEIDLPILISKFSNSSSWIKINGHFQSEEGMLSFEQPGEETTQWAFSADHAWGSNGGARYQIYCPQNKSERCLTISFDRQGGVLTSKDVDAVFLAQFLHTLLPGLEAWDLTSGTLNGNFSFEISSGRLKKTNGDLTLRDFSLTHAKNRIKADFEELHLNAAEKQDAPIAFEFLNGALQFADREGLYGTLRDLKGSIELVPDEGLKIISSGMWSSSNQNSMASFEASARAPDFAKAHLKLHLHHLGPLEPSTVEVSTEALGDGELAVDIYFNNVRQREFSFAQHLLDAIAADLNPFSYVSGTLSANCQLRLKSGRLTSVAAENLVAHDLFIFAKPWELALGSKSLKGRFCFDLSAPSPKDTVDVSLSVQGGQIALTGVNLDPWNFTDIETRLEVVKGTLQDSSASVRLAGLKGRAEIIGGRTADLMRLSFQGKATELIPFASEQVQKGINKALKDDLVTLKAEVNRRSHGVEVTGRLAIKSEHAQGSSPIDFGFLIERIFPSLLPANMDAQESYFAALTPAVQTALMPDRDLLLSCLMQQHLKRETGYSGFKLHKGWVKADQLLLDKFIGPFLFPEGEFKLSGLADVEGIFDSTGLYIGYHAKNLILENEQLSIQVPEVSSSSREPIAFYAVDFGSRKDFGYLPVKEGSYFDKDSGLLFTEMRGNIVFEGEKVHVENLGAYSNGIYFEGDVAVDYSTPLKGYYDVAVHAGLMEGTFRQAQHLLAHFDKTAFISKIPLEGILNFGSEGALLQFGIRPEGVDFQAHFECLLSEGKLFCENGDLSLQELNFNFVYDHKKNILELSDLQSMLLIGKSERVDEYSVHADRIYFDDFARNHASFDIWIKDDARDFIRLAGFTRAEDPLQRDPLQRDKVEFCFDKELSHFGEIHPSAFSLVLTDWNRVDKLELAADFKLSTLLHDLQKIGGSPLSFIFEDALYGLDQLSLVGGELSLKLGFEGSQGTFGFDISGQDLVFNQHEVKEFQLSGYKRAERWLIEQLQMDNISIAAELFNKGKLWQVDFLGLRYGDALLIGLDGSYRGKDTPIQAHVNLFEVDLSKLPDWAWVRTILEAHQVTGKFKGTGEVVLHKKEKEGFEIETLLDISSRDVKIDGYYLKNADHFSFHLSTDKGWTLKNVATGLVFGDMSEGIKFEIKELGYDFDADIWTLDEMPFSIAPEQLSWAAVEIERHFPSALDEELLDDVKHLKSESAVQGTFKLRKSPSDCACQLTLEDGIYRLWGELRELKKMTLDYAEDELAISALYVLNEQPIWISTRLSTLQAGRGEIILADTNPEELDKPALIVVWRRDIDKGLVIEKASGHLAGLQVDLKENEKHHTTGDAFHLVGALDVDGTLTRPLLPPMFSAAIETLQVGKGYRIQGAFEIGKEAMNDGERELRFFGTLSGNGVELKGYRFDRLFAEVILDAGSIQLLDFTLSDLAGVFHIGNLRADKLSNGSWHLSIPLLTAYEVRPSLLKEVKQVSGAIRKPLVIRQFFIQDLTGVLGNAETFRGRGTFHFINPQKKNLQNTIFAIPAEILTRIGLNLSVLTPVSGTIHFEVRGERMFLTKFKDVYSDNKISKFYLATSGGPSTVDLDGNLNIQVRFKQSTLLLKLAEMFTINIHGNLNKPLYSLQRQKYLINQEVFASTDIQEPGTDAQ